MLRPLRHPAYDPPPGPGENRAPAGQGTYAQPLLSGNREAGRFAAGPLPKAVFRSTTGKQQRRCRAEDIPVRTAERRKACRRYSRFAPERLRFPAVPPTLRRSAPESHRPAEPSMINFYTFVPAGRPAKRFNTPSFPCFRSVSSSSYRFSYPPFFRVWKSPSSLRTN